MSIKLKALFNATIRPVILFFTKVAKSVGKVFSHFQTIKNDPGKFILWFFTSVVLSLSTLWIPSLLGCIIDEDFFTKVMNNNPIVMFSVVFLSNSVLTSINYIGAGSTRFAVSIRGITLVITILYLIFLSTIFPLKLVLDVSLTKKVQGILLLITVLIGIYVYGFRDSSWEKSVDDVRAEQEEEVDELKEEAEKLEKEGEIKL